MAEYYITSTDEDGVEKTIPSDEAKRLLKESDERFQLSSDYWADARSAFRDDIDFAVLENQWPDAIKRERDLDSRPCLTVNRMMQFIRQVTNDQRQNKPGIKVRPFDDHADYETAEVMQGLIRHIEANSNADLAYDTATFYQVAGGFGFIRVITDYPDYSFDQEIYIKPIPNPLSVYWDHNSRCPDGSDFEYCFVIDEIPKTEFEDRFPDAPAGFTDGDDSDWETEDTVRLAEYWYKEKEEVKIHLLEDGRVVEDSEYQEMETKPKILKSRTQTVKRVKWILRGGDRILDGGDWAGTHIPIVPVWGDWSIVDNKVVISSLIRPAKDAQRMYNYWRSTETELLSLTTKAPYIAAEGQIDGYEDLWENANTSHLSVLPYVPVNGAPPPVRLGFDAPPSGILAATQNAEMDMMNTIGIQRAGLGMPSNETSGKAIAMRQREGDVATYHFIDNSTRAIRLLGQILVDLIPKTYDTKRVIRVLGEDGEEKTVKIGSKENDEIKEIEPIYDLGVGNYDIVVSAGPNYTTRRQEAQDAMMQMLPNAPQLMQVAGDLIFKAMDWPMADDIAERLQKTLPPELRPKQEGEDGEAPEQLPPEVMQQMQQMQQQIEMMGQALQNADAQLQEAQSKQAIEERKIALEEFNAQTARLKVEQDAQLKALELAGKKNTDDLTELEKEQFNADLQIRLTEMKQEHELQKMLLEQRFKQQEAMAQQPQQIQIERDETGQIVAVGGRPVLRDEAGNIIGVG